MWCDQVESNIPSFLKYIQGVFLNKYHEFNHKNYYVVVDM